jgi:hypothetical protein
MHAARVRTALGTPCTVQSQPLRGLGHTRLDICCVSGESSVRAPYSTHTGEWYVGGLAGQPPFHLGVLTLRATPAVASRTVQMHGHVIMLAWPLLGISFLFAGASADHTR